MKKTDHVYLNVQIAPTTTVGNSLALYTESFSRAILNNCDEYYLAVARFSCPLSEIPILKFPVNILQPNPNQSNLVIGIRNGANLFSVPVVFQAQNNTAVPIAAAAVPFFNSSQISSKYYDIFSVSALLTMINSALNAALILSGVAVATPIYSWSPTTQLLSLSVSAAFLASGLQIFMNEQLNNYLAGFQYFQSFGTLDEYTHVFPTVPGAFVLTEDYTTIGLWFDIRKLILTSTTLPINQETSPTLDSLSGQSQGIISYSPILTDFIISFDSTQGYLSYANYNPDTYRLIDFKTSAPIDKLNLQFFWVTKTGIQIPVEISPSQTCTIKLAFLQKSLYNNEY